MRRSWTFPLFLLTVACGDGASSTPGAGGDAGDTPQGLGGVTCGSGNGGSNDSMCRSELACSDGKLRSLTCTGGSCECVEGDTRRVIADVPLCDLSLAATAEACGFDVEIDQAAVGDPNEEDCWTSPSGCSGDRDVPYFKCDAKRLCDPLILPLDDSMEGSASGPPSRLPENGEALVACMLEALRAGTPGSMRIERTLQLGRETTDIIILEDRGAVFIVDNSLDNTCKYQEVARELKPAQYFDECPRTADALFECINAGYEDTCIGAPVCR